MTTHKMLPRILFWLSCLLTALLLGLVFFTPLLTRRLAGSASPRWLTLFATDATLRRVTIASALGILVSGCVLFRSQTDR